MRLSPLTKQNRLNGSTITTYYTFKPLSFESIKVEPNVLQWNRVQPIPRSGHRIVCDDGNFFSIGGYSLSEAVNNSLQPEPAGYVISRICHELWCFNYTQRQWKLLHTEGAFPKNLASHSAILHGNYLVVFGGTGFPFGRSLSNNMYICDLSTLIWKCVITSGDPPTPMYGQAIVMNNNCFYVIGGTTGYDYSMDIHKLDTTTFHWETLYLSGAYYTEPPSRYRHDVAFNGEHIYILGGGNSTHTHDMSLIPAFNVNTCKWSTVQTNITDNVGLKGFPRPRKCQTCVQRGDLVFISGGYDSKIIFMDLWKLDLSRMTWTFMPVQLPIPVYFHAASITPGGCMYVFGGVTNIDRNGHASARTDQIFKIWLVVPKLKEICWEAVLHYDSSIKRQSCNSLLEKGIPQEFVQRVYPTPPGGCRSNNNKQWEKWNGIGDLFKNDTD